MTRSDKNRENHDTAMRQTRTISLKKRNSTESFKNQKKKAKQLNLKDIKKRNFLLDEISAKQLFSCAVLYIFHSATIKPKLPVKELNKNKVFARFLSLLKTTSIFAFCGNRNNQNTKISHSN